MTRTFPSPLFARPVPGEDVSRHAQLLCQLCHSGPWRCRQVVWHEPQPGQHRDLYRHAQLIPAPTSPSRKLEIPRRQPEVANQLGRRDLGEPTQAFELGIGEQPRGHPPSPTRSPGPPRPCRNRCFFGRYYWDAGRAQSSAELTVGRVELMDVRSTWGRWALVFVLAVLRFGRDGQQL